MEAVIATGIGVTGAMGGAIASNAIIKKSDVSLFDYFSGKIFHFMYYSEEYTEIIDALLMDTNKKNKIGHKIATNNGTIVPGYGKHEIKLDVKIKNKIEKRTLDIEKIFVKSPVTDKNMTIYRAKYFWKSSVIIALTLLENIKQIYKTGKNISTISIDTSSETPKLLPVRKIYHSPKPNQTKALKHIMTKWNHLHYYNIKVVICGERGVGKTQMGTIIKRHLDTTYADCFSRLYDDFNPKSVGVNIKSSALQSATANSPVIIVINEIETIFDYVIDDTKQNFDPRLQHAKDRNTFNNMLDDIGSMLYVITIFTTEKSPEQLKANPEYKSFIRKGRVDFFIKMTETDSELVVNN